jgi:hypothetical protein
MALADNWPEIRCHRRSAGAAKDGRTHCSRNNNFFHDDAQSPMKLRLSLTNQTGDANQNSRIG